MSLSNLIQTCTANRRHRALSIADARLSSRSCAFPGTKEGPAKPGKFNAEMPIRLAACATFALLLSACATGASASSHGRDVDPSLASKMSLAEAKEIIEYADRHQYSRGHLTFRTDRIIIDNIDTDYHAPFCEYDDLEPRVYDDQPRFTALSEPSTCGEDWNGTMPTMAQAAQVAAALLRWKNSTVEERQAFLSAPLDPNDSQFAPVVATYQAANPKPEISEDVRRFKVIAEAAVKDKRFGDAANAYKDGLEIAPWWPQGQFNAALLLGELHYYDEAIMHMKRYLKLVPDAPDARAAQDKIYEWEGAKEINK